MSDQTKTRLAIFFLISAVLLPCVGLAIGWIGWDFKTGAIVALCSFVFFFLLSGILLATVKDLSWFTVSLPFLFGSLYSILPDFIIGPIDDAAAVAAGAIFSFVLALRKEPETPKWIVFPLFAAGIYTLVGGLVPGPVDELLVDAVALGIASYGITTKQLRGGSDSQGSDGFIDDDCIETEFEVRE